MGRAAYFKNIKKVRQILKLFLLTLLLLLIGAYLALRTSPVQTWLAGMVTKELSEQAGVPIRVDRVDLEWFRTISLEGVYVEDLHKDTLLYSKEIKGSIGSFAFFEKRLHLDHLQLESPHVELKRYSDRPDHDIRSLIESFSSKDTSGKGWEFRVETLGIDDGSFVHHDQHAPSKPKGQMDFKNFRMRHIRLAMTNIHREQDSVAVQIQDLAFEEERSGLTLDSLVTRASYSKSGIDLNKLYLKTPGSRLKGDIGFGYDNLKALQNWVREVEMKLELGPSILASQDLAFFVSKLKGMRSSLKIKGAIQGTVSELSADDLLLELTPNTFFKGDIEMNGLPDLSGTFIAIEADRANARKRDLEKIPLPPFDKDRTLSLPPQLNRLGDIAFQGRFTGFINDFVAEGTLNSDVGKLKADLSVARDSSKGRFEYEGILKAERFDVGDYYQVPNMGRMDARMEVKGSGFGIEHVNTEVKGTIEKFGYRNYTYKDLSVKGDFHNGHFRGKTESNDPNFDFAFNGSINLRGEIPRYSFEMAIERVRPGVLNLVDRDSSISLSTKLEFEGEGVDLAHLKGKLGAYGTIYREEGLKYELGDIELKASRSGDQRSLRLTSTPLIGSIKGKFDLTHLPVHFTEQVQKVLPSIFDEKMKQLSSEQDFSFSLQLIKTEPLADLLLPKWDLADNTAISGSFDSEKNTFKLDGFAPYLGYEEKRMSGIKINAYRHKGVLETEFNADTLWLSDSLLFKSPHLMGKALDDNLQLQTGWEGGHPDTKGNFKSVFQFKGPGHFDLEVLSSSFVIQGKDWGLEPKGRVFIDSSSLRFEKIRFGDGKRSISLNGTYSRDPGSELRAAFKDFEIGVFAPFLPSDIEPEGTVNGHAMVSDPYGTPHFESDIRIEKTALSGHELGTLQLSSDWVNERNALSLEGSIEKNGDKDLTLGGYYFPNRDSSLDIDLQTEELSIAPLNAFIQGGISDIKGTLKGPLHLGGNLAKPLLTGKVDAHEVKLTIEQLNVTYGFHEEPITFYKDMIGFDHIPVYYLDPKTDKKVKDRGRATGTLIHDHFQGWNFNIFLEMERMLGMNLSKKMNDLYYGTAYGTGTLEIFGHPGTLNINVNARTEKGTDLKLPLGGSEEVQMGNFVKFVDKDASKKEEAKRDLTGIDMNFNLEVTPEARISIIFDKKIGDVMKGRGKGNIKMEVNTNGKFNMYGKFHVHKGDYLFTMRNVINKRFSVKKGGTIEWFGDPYEAVLDLDAIYDLRTSIYPLMQGMEGGKGYKRRIPVKLVMHLSRELMDPEVSFDIRFPTLEEGVKTMAKSGIESPNKQAFSLLVLKRFINEHGQGTGSDRAGVHRSTSSELLSNQLSNWLSSISKEFNLGVNYRPGDEVTDQELALALSTKLFNERVSFSGNFGVSSASKYSQQQGKSKNKLVGDFTIQYDITRDGKFRLKVFNESNEDRIENIRSANYTQGVGLYYQEEFDSAKELLKGLRDLFRREKKKGKSGKKEQANPDQKEKKEKESKGQKEKEEG
ncbi:MAG: translocation/assembly module TamB domain-containing protein [Flavobacteriales bacterium]